MDKHVQDRSGSRSCLTLASKQFPFYNTIFLLIKNKPVAFQCVQAQNSIGAILAIKRNHPGCAHRHHIDQLLSISADTETDFRIIENTNIAEELSVVVVTGFRTFKLVLDVRKSSALNTDAEQCQQSNSSHGLHDIHSIDGSSNLALAGIDADPHSIFLQHYRL